MMNNLSDVARPGLMLSQVWPTSRETEGATLKGLEIALSSGDFRSFQSVEIPFPMERKAFARLLGDTGHPYTYCLARVLNEGGYNLADLDDANRRRSCDAVVRSLDDAREAGADSVSLVSGPGPAAVGDRPAALAALRDSLRVIARRAAESPALSILIEPLDVEAHKKMALGSTQEAVAICRALKDEGLDLRLTLDAAHIILNGESTSEALNDALEFTADFHYCNAVLDRSSSWFGDHHLRFGPPGVVDVKAIAVMMRHQVAVGYFSEERRPPVMCEVLLRDGDRSESLMTYCAEIMNDAWDLAWAEGASPVQTMQSVRRGEGA